MSISRDINTITRTTGLFAIGGFVTYPLLSQGSDTWGVGRLEALVGGAFVGFGIGVCIAVTQEILDCLNVNVELNVTRHR